MMKHHKKTNIFFIFFIITILMTIFSSTQVTFREKKRDRGLIWDESQRKV